MPVDSTDKFECAIITAADKIACTIHSCTGSLKWACNEALSCQFRAIYVTESETFTGNIQFTGYSFRY
ncbi:hypothetical protein WS68_16695 [Burkholderia sp. TSV86]|nr:hypothetical protein WS68_16695 [Burkholderia sp. TSV86]